MWSWNFQTCQSWNVEAKLRSTTPLYCKLQRTKLEAENMANFYQSRIQCVCVWGGYTNKVGEGTQGQMYNNTDRWASLATGYTLVCLPSILIQTWLQWEGCYSMYKGLPNHAHFPLLHMPLCCKYMLSYNYKPRTQTKAHKWHVTTCVVANG